MQQPHIHQIHIASVTEHLHDRQIMTAQLTLQIPFSSQDISDLSARLLLASQKVRACDCHGCATAGHHLVDQNKGLNPSQAAMT